MGESNHCSYTIKIKGQKIIVEDNTEEVRASKIETLNNLRKQIASLEYELGYDVDVDDEEEDEEEESDDDWDDED